MNEEQAIRNLEINQEAYSLYYDSCFEVDINNPDFIKCKCAPLTFNRWYGTNDHKKYLRKFKLLKIKKAVI